METAPSVSPGPARVLVIEDADHLREMLSRYLRHLGYEVSVAPDLASAKLALQEHAFHAVLADLNLPDGEGTELLPELPPRCWFLSLSGLIDVIPNPEQPAWIAHLTKPFLPGDLQKAMDREWPEDLEPDMTLLDREYHLPPIVLTILHESARLLVRGEIPPDHFQANLQRLRREEFDPRGLHLTSAFNGSWPARFRINDGHRIDVTLRYND